MDTGRPPATPYLAVDTAVLRANIDRTAQAAAQRGVALRPHVKTHKCLEIARLQRAAGAAGITVATLGEAEVFVDDGHDDVFVAYPVWVDARRGRRLSALRDRARLAVGIDSAEGAAQLARHSPGATVLVEVDSGHHRTGVRPADAGPLADRARRLGLDVRGVFTFPGHSYAPQARATSASDETSALAAAALSLADAGVEPAVVSGGSSPSLAATLDPAPGDSPGPGSSPLTELRPGAYVFNDAQQWELGACTAADIALTAHATVVSHAGGRVVLDAGSKTLAADRAAWATGGGRLLDHPDARVVVLSEHHAVAELPGVAPAGLPPLGSIVRVVPNHCCNAVALADELVVDCGVDGGAGDGLDGTVDGGPVRWRVAARGRND